jgi:hypothetical protein
MGRFLFDDRVQAVVFVDLGRTARRRISLSMVPMKIKELPGLDTKPDMQRRHLPGNRVPTPRMLDGELRENRAYCTPSVGPGPHQAGRAIGPRYGQLGYTLLKSHPLRPCPLQCGRGGSRKRNYAHMEKSIELGSSHHLGRASYFAHDKS